MGFSMDLGPEEMAKVREKVEEARDYCYSFAPYWAQIPRAALEVVDVADIMGIPVRSIFSFMHWYPLGSDIPRVYVELETGELCGPDMLIAALVTPEKSKLLNPVEILRGLQEIAKKGAPPWDNVLVFKRKRVEEFEKDVLERVAIKASKMRKISEQAC